MIQQKILILRGVTMKKRNKIMVAAVVGIGIAAFVLALTGYRLSGSTKVLPEADIIGAQTVFYQQKDDRWADDKMGTSEYTIGPSGCIVSCIASAMQMGIAGFPEKEFVWGSDPGELNQYLSQHQVYDSQGNMQWEPLNALDDFTVDVYQGVSSELIQKCLQQGHYPIVRVRMNGFGNFHYVLITEAREGMFYCMDPLNEAATLTPLSEFGNRVYAIRCVYPAQ